MRVRSFLAVALVVVGCRGKAKKEEATVVPAPVVSVAAKPDPVTLVLEAPTLVKAIRAAKPLLVDSSNKDSDGSVAILGWMLLHGQWTDVGVAEDETNYAMVQKDPESEGRGDREGQNW